MPQAPASSPKAREVPAPPGVGDNPASGGEKKRAALAHAFAQEPDLLLLDEPTNHLDVAGILTLEELLLKQKSSIVITHDRAFLDRVCTRILELDRGRLFSFPGNYSSYEGMKQSQLASEAVSHAKFDKFWGRKRSGSAKGWKRAAPATKAACAASSAGDEERRPPRAPQREATIGAGQRSASWSVSSLAVSKKFSDVEVVKT